MVNSADPFAKFREVEAQAILGSMHWLDVGDTKSALSFYQRALNVKPTFPDDVELPVFQREIAQRVVPNVYRNSCLLFSEKRHHAKAKH